MVEIPDFRLGFFLTFEVTYFLSFVWNTHLTEVLSLGFFFNMLKIVHLCKWHILLAGMNKVYFVYLNKRQPLHSMPGSICVTSTDLEKKIIVFWLIITCIFKKNTTNKKCPKQFRPTKNPLQKATQPFWGLKMQGNFNYMSLNSNFTGWQKIFVLQKSQAIKHPCDLWSILHAEWLQYRDTYERWTEMENKSGRR